MLQGPRAAAAAANGGHRWSPMSPAWTRSPSPGCRWTPLASRYWNAVVGLRASRAPCRRLRSAMHENQSGFRTSGGARATVAAWRGAQVGVVNGEERCALHGATMLDGLVFAYKQGHTDSGIPGHWCQRREPPPCSVPGCPWRRGGVSLRAPRVVRWMHVSLGL